MTRRPRGLVKAGIFAGEPAAPRHVFWATLHGLVVLHLAGKLPTEPDFWTIQREAMRLLVTGARAGAATAAAAQPGPRGARHTAPDRAGVLRVVAAIRPASDRPQTDNASGHRVKIDSTLHETKHSVGRIGTRMSQDAEVFAKLMASEEAKRAYQNDPIFRHVMDVVRMRVAEGGDPLVTIGQALASLQRGQTEGRGP